MFHYPHPQAFVNNRPASTMFMPPQPFFYRPNGPVLNHSTHNLNFTHDFDHFTTPNPGFTSVPSGAQPVFDYPNQHFEQQRWRQNMHRAQQQQQHRRTPAFHFQDKSTSYFMTDPIITSNDRIMIHLTKVHIGPNGDQQRVFVEQEFSNENELNKFVRNLRQNFEKTFNNRSSAGDSHTDESSSTNSKKSGVVVVEEPDEEPKVYQQQAYNENIESKKAAASVLTPPSSPGMEPATPSKPRERSSSPPPPPIEHQTRFNRHPKNKTKYRRQPADHRDEMNSSRVFHQPGYSRPYQATPIPPRFQQRFYNPTNDLHLPPNPNFQRRYNQNGYPKHRSRSFVPPINDHFPPPPAPPRFQHPPDPFGRPNNPTRFVPSRQKEFRPPPSPARFRRSHRRKGANQPTTITENHVYPNHEQKQPRVHRTKSECRNTQNGQQHRSRSTTNHFPQFSPLQQPPIIQRHFVHFRPPPVILSSVHSTAALFHPNQRRIQPQPRFINQFRLGTNRF